MDLEHQRREAWYRELMRWTACLLPQAQSARAVPGIFANGQAQPLWVRVYKSDAYESLTCCTANALGTGLGGAVAGK